MRGAIVGFGNIATAHLAGFALLPEIEIVAVVDPSPTRRAAALRLFPSVRTYARIDELASSEALDFIDICCPPKWHAEYIFTGLRNGWHVLCEKPVLLTLAECSRLEAATAATGVLFPCHNYKFSPVIQTVKQLVDAEEFGGVRAGHFRILRQRHGRGNPDWRPDWRRDPAISGGGVLRDHGTHAVYIATHLCGQTPSAVSCVTGISSTGAFAGTEDTALLTLYFPERVVFTIHLSWAASIRETSYVVTGTREMLMLEDDTFIHVRNGRGVEHRSTASEFDDPLHREWFAPLLRDFVDAVAHPARRLSMVREAIVTTAVIDCAYRSAARNGETVDLPVPALDGDVADDLREQLDASRFEPSPTAVGP